MVQQNYERIRIVNLTHNQTNQERTKQMSNKPTADATTETPYFSKLGQTYDGYVVGEDYLDLGKIESIEVQKWLGGSQIALIVNGDTVLV